MWTEPINIMSLILFSLALNSIGLLSKYKIFLLFSIGGYITLITIFIDSEGLVIAFIGIILFNLWYATLGGKQ